MKPIIGKVVKLTLVTALTGLTLVAPVAAADVHRVQAGESLWSISRQHNVDMDTLARINGIRDITQIREGMELKLNDAPAVQIYKVRNGESLWSISRKFGVSYQNLIEFNELRDPDKIYVGMELKIPGGGAAAVSARQSQFIWPAEGRLTSQFGKRWGKLHEGIDIGLPIGRDIVAAASGKVIMSGWISGYGHTVIIEHEDGYRTLYGHNSKLLANSGEYVAQGEKIALSGNSGRSTGPHLHFEIQKDGRALDPMKFLK